MTATERGSLQIKHTVVRKLAQHAADQVRGVAVDERRPAGIGTGTWSTTAKVHGAGNDVDLELDLALHYPGPVRTVVADVRRKVTAEIEHITSYRVRSLTVTVSALVPDIPPRVR
ncbi:MAG: Asp23/Gls24 family envelope stress response protein [Haloechinothrix sp.]